MTYVADILDLILGDYPSSPYLDMGAVVSSVVFPSVPSTVSIRTDLVISLLFANLSLKIAPPCKLLCDYLRFILSSVYDILP